MKPCGCRVDTPLEKLCEDCLRKAWVYAEYKRKNPEPVGHDYKSIWSEDKNHVEQVRK